MGVHRQLLAGRAEPRRVARRLFMLLCRRAAGGVLLLHDSDTASEDAFECRSAGGGRLALGFRRKCAAVAIILSVQHL